MIWGTPYFDVLFFYGNYFFSTKTTLFQLGVGEEIADIFPKRMFGCLGKIPYGGFRGLGWLD